MNSFDYSSIFTKYKTIEGLDFNLLMSKINLPQDMSLDFYEKKYITVDTPWTIISYQLYDTINLWWILCLLNQSQVMYAQSETEIYIINKNYISDIIDLITSQLN